MTRKRPGFTLVELLVVISLMAVLFGLVLSVGRGGGAKSSARRAAQEFASMLLAAQSRALGRPEGAAVLIEADAAAPRIGRLLHEGIAAPPLVVSVDQNGRLGANPQLSRGYKVRFQMKSGNGSTVVSPWLALRNREPLLRGGVAQTAENTITVPPAADEAVVIRYPTAGPRPFELSGRVGVDLRHSGVGEDPAAAHGHGRFQGQGPVAVVFDRTGRVAEVIQQVGTASGPPLDPIVPTEIIYFLFADRDDIASTDLNRTLANNNTFWVAVNPQTGRINVSANQPSSTGDLVVAREKARKATAIGK